MRQVKDDELNTRIHDFLDKKFTKYPELRDSVKAGGRKIIVHDRLPVLSWPFRATS